MKKTSYTGNPNFIHILLLLTGIIAVSSCQKESQPVSPTDALSTFELDERFKIELFAAEPLLGDPVDMEIDEFGRLYIVEMPGYPLDKSGSGKINILSDTDGDGEWTRARFSPKVWCYPIVSCGGKKE
jgi:hypothetical protein